MKLYHKLLLGFFYVTLAFVAVYSYVLIDPNITLLNNAWWAQAREFFIQIGYFQRQLSTAIYAGIIAVLFVVHYFIVKEYKHLSMRLLLIPLVVLGVVSYPLLSHDFFNYLFDAKIITVYHANPYLQRALDYPADEWVRFMHWTHRTYGYGPVFLPLTLIPSFLSLGKLLLNIIFFKTFFVGFYLLGVYSLYRLNRRYAVLFATHPLVIIEGLVSSHNDIVAVGLGLAGVYLLFRDRSAQSYILRILSGGIKYFTLPLILLTKSNRKMNILAGALVFALIAYVSAKDVIQPWYFLNLLIFIPFFEVAIARSSLFFAGLLLSYYPFIMFGDWTQITLKYWIIGVAAGLNLLATLFFWLKGRGSNS